MLPCIFAQLVRSHPHLVLVSEVVPPVFPGFVFIFARDWGFLGKVEDVTRVDEDYCEGVGRQRVFCGLLRVVRGVRF